MNHPPTSKWKLLFLVIAVYFLLVTIEIIALPFLLAFGESPFLLRIIGFLFVHPFGNGESLFMALVVNALFWSGLFVAVGQLLSAWRNR